MSGTQTSASAQAVTLGNWITQSINGMQYEVLLPANYNPAVSYSTVLYLHQLDMGDFPSALVDEVNPWFNTTAFRTDHPAIIVMPLLDQTADPSGQTINWGGISTQDSTGELNALAALKQVQSQYSTDTTRTYVTGNSMGGIGTEDMLIKYNAFTGTEGKIFAAGLALAGADYGQGFPTPNQSVVTGLKNVPYWAIHGGQDGQVPLAFDQNLFAAEQASGGIMKYTQDNSLGHDVWDTYYTQTGASSPLGWLFSQSTGGVGQPPPTPPPTFKPSPNDAVVTGTTGSITDSTGHKWTITAGGQVAVNGVADTTTSGVIELAYVNGTIWQENGNKLWWGETQPNASWAPTAGTSVSPLPVTQTPPPTPTPTSPNDTVVKGTTGSIVDAAGHKWTITAGGQVAVNGVADTTTSGVIELAYVNGTIWQENGNKLWWGETQPNASWAPTAGTSVSPLPVTQTPPPTPTPTSPNNTVVKGTAGSIVDAAGHKWTITAGGQVAVNGVADTTTSGVIELAYVNGKIWQENASKLWWGETQPNASWAPAAGTSVSPLPATPPPTPTPVSPNNTVVTGTAGAIIDAAGHKWTITAGGQVAVNGVADTTTSGVIELAYVTGKIWQENGSKLWWGETQPNASWAPTAGTSVSPLPVAVSAAAAITGVVPPQRITIAAGTTSATVSQNQVSVVATSGDHMLFVSGSGDTVSMSGGVNTITDTGSGNTYVLPAAGNGMDSFTGNILTNGDTLDLTTALAATGWNGSASTLSSYLTVANSAKGATLSISATPGGSAMAIASIDGASTAALTSVLAHAIS